MSRRSGSREQVIEGKATTMRRTTVLLREDDQRNLERVAAMQGGISDVEAIRRSLNLARELLEWAKEEGGEIILQKGRRRERIRFL
jgi:hypothetical protein